MSEDQLPLSPLAAAPTGQGWLRFNPLWTFTVLAVLLLAFQWYDTRRTYAELRQELARRLLDAETSGRASKLLAEDTQRALRDTQARVSLLDAQQAEARSQQAALEVLYRQLAESRDDALLVEIEHMIAIAAQQLQLAGNVRAATTALETADTRLQRADKPQFLVLRKAVARDLERLRSLPYVDIAGMSLRLDAIAVGLDELPLIADERPARQVPAKSVKEKVKLGWMDRVAGLGDSYWQEIRQLVRVQRMDRPEPVLLSPPQTFFLRENLRLRLLDARLALMQRDESTFRSDLKAARKWIERYFDLQSPATVSVIKSLDQLAAAKFEYELPSLSDSMGAVTEHKLIRQRTPK